MGRQTRILKVNIYDDAGGDIVMNPSPELKSKILDKYGVSHYCWHFGDDGAIEFRNRYQGMDVYGEIDDHIRVLLETCKEIDHYICGTFSYDDDQTGGHYHGLVYITTNLTAMIKEFNIDFHEDDLESINTTPETRYITI